MPLPILLQLCYAGGVETTPENSHLSEHRGFNSGHESGRGLDLPAKLVPHPLASYFYRMSGDALAGFGVLDGDILVVDRSLLPESGDLVAFALHGESFVRRLEKQGQTAWLCSADAVAYPPITADGEVQFIGVVVSVARCLKS